MCSFNNFVDRAMLEVRFLGVVIFGRFVPDSGFGTYICHFVRLGQLTLKQLR